VFNACSLVNLGTMITSSNSLLVRILCLHFVSLAYKFTRRRNHSNHKLTRGNVDLNGVQDGGYFVFRSSNMAAVTSRANDL